MITLNKEQLAALETSLYSTQLSHSGSASEKIIKETLEEAFKGNTFTVNIKWDTGSTTDNMFVMSVYPEVGTVNKIIDALVSGNDGKVIKKLWDSNKVWTLEIDGRIMDKSIIDFSKRELTAMLLHEVGHIVDTNSIPSRISTILRYEIAKSGYKAKGMLGCSIFRSIMSLPIFDSCVADSEKTKSSIHSEIKADSYVKKCGYGKDLQSALIKLLNNNAYKNNGTTNNKLQKVSDFSVLTLNDLQARRDHLAKKRLLKLRESVNSDFMESVIDNILDTIFEDNGDRKGWKNYYIHETADKAIDGYIMNEFFVFKNKLKKIEPVEFDYIEAKMREMKTDEDRAILLSYISSKQDLVNYYISLINHPNPSKYSVPHTVEQLKIYQKKLLMLRDAVIKFKLPVDTRVTYITWPNGPARALYVPQVDWPEGYDG